MMKLEIRFVFAVHFQFNGETYHEFGSMEVGDGDVEEGVCDFHERSDFSAAESSRNAVQTSS